MGSFPQLRKKLHNHLTIFPPENIFTSHTIMDHYAFHYGGRKELQFNIGFIEYEGDEKFRYGVALSFEENKTLPNFRVLEKQFIRFNEYIKVNKTKLTEYILYYHDDIRDERFFISIDEVNAALFRAETFIFLGKIISPNKIEYEEILSTFDQLLDMYSYVEGDSELIEIDTTTDGKFEFKPGITKLVAKALRKSPARKSDVILRHNQIQGKLANKLIQQYGEECISTEQNTGSGTNIDIVVKNKSEMIFYEIKTHSSIRLCLREALGQLIEYAYWSKETNPTKLVVISEKPITDKAKEFLKTLRKEVNLNIYYQQFDYDNNILGGCY